MNIRKMHIVIGTRGSKLALYNTKKVINAIKNVYKKNISISIKVIKSYGDIDNRNLQDMQERGIFTKALEEELLKDKIDIAIHSFKDLPTDLTPGLFVIGTLTRENVFDIVITKNGEKLSELPPASFIGTGSIRRIFQLENYFRNKQFTFKNIRGNIDTRIKKVLNGKYNAIVISGSAIPILNDVKYEKLDYDIMLPAPAQSAICFQIKNDNKKLNELLHSISDKKSFFECQIEREVLKIFGGGCFNKIACRYFYDNKLLKIRFQKENNNVKDLTLTVENIHDLYRQLKIHFDRPIGIN